MQTNNLFDASYDKMDEAINLMVQKINTSAMLREFERVGLLDQGSKVIAEIERHIRDPFFIEDCTLDIIDGV